MAIITSDLHGNFKKVKQFLEYKPEEQHVFAGDILDSFSESGRSQTKALDLLLDSNCELLWGNHELHYRSNPPFNCSGWNRDYAQIFNSILELNQDRFKNAVHKDGYLITHAGLADRWVRFNDIDEQVNFLNSDIADNQRELYAIGYARGGNDTIGGVFWFDHLREGYDFNKVAESVSSLSPQFNQVFGHTASEKPVEYRGDNFHHVCINTWDGKEDLYIFDTKLKEVVKIG